MSMLKDRNNSTKTNSTSGQRPSIYSTRSNSKISALQSKVKKPKMPINYKSSPFKAGVLVAACLLAGFGGGWLGANTYSQSSAAPISSEARQKYISSESELISDIADTTGKSVVSVDVKSRTTTQDFFGNGRSSVQQSAGTGFVIDSKGIIVTNRHVVPAGISSVSITLDDGTTFDDVEVIGRTSASSTLDVAFLKINDLKGKKLTAVKLGDSSRVDVGDRVVAIGNALGQFQNTVTSGIISGFGRDVTAGDETGFSTESLNDLFQTDAAINQGNSGGPLVNINGEVIGINTAVASTGQNIGFAIPINDIKGLINSILTKGELEQPYLGVRYISLTDAIASQLDIKIKRGAYISTTGSEDAVVKDSPADKAGLKAEDVITKVNSIKIDDKTSLTAALSRFKVGDIVTLTVIRYNKTITLNATLGNLPN
jgi:serine protease Do